MRACTTSRTCTARAIASGHGRRGGPGVAERVLRDARWRGPAVPWAAAVLLAPVVPRHGRALVGDPATEAAWQQALTWWGIADGPVDAPGGLVLATAPEQALASGAETVLLAGRDRDGRLAAAGYRTRTWTARSAAGGATALVVEGEVGPPASRPSTARARARATAVTAVRRMGGTSQVTVACRSGGPPALAARAGADRAYVLAGGGGPRRRPVLVTGGASDPGQARILKVSRLAEAARGDREQQVLTRLQTAGLGGGIPEPLGSDRVGPFAWSSESVSAGRPLADLLGERPPAQVVRDLLEQVADWLDRLGAATRTTAVDLRGLPLAGGHERLRSALDRSDVPGVLLHGDLAAGFNLLVDGRSWTVLDWETAREAGPPLLDLLPLLCGALAALHAPPGPSDQAAYVLRLCAGQEADSAWLLHRVARHLRALGVRVELAGVLAELAFGYQASMRLVHEQLVRDSGEEPPRWRSLWDEVAQQWPEVPALGPGWDALHAILRG